MSENEKKFMDGIITVKDALRWFDYTSKTGYRKPNECDFRLGNEPENYFFGLNGFEPDSSPIAWIHYNKHYTEDTFGACKDEPSHSKNFTDEDRKYSFSNGKLGYSGRKPNIRLHAIPKWYFNSLFTRANRNKQTFDASGIERLGGDCDFNFDGTLAFDGSLFDDGSNDSKLFNHCTTMHHNHLNFSLMQGMGDMQGLKKTFASERLDCFLSFLDGYYKIHLEDVRMRLAYLTWKKDGTERACKNVANIACLNHYLSQFGNIYDYCAKIYFLPTKNHHTGMMKNEKVFNKIAPLLDKEGSDWHKLLKSNDKLINALITSGAMDFEENSKENRNYNQELAKDYMRLAVQFWQAKEEYFKLMDTILSPEAEKQ